MAGDWIKFEHATLDKPEVLRAAEMMCMDRDRVLGIFLRYWVWLDKNLSPSCPGFVPHVSRKSLDEVLDEPGFAATLEAIGWAKFDDKTWTLTVSNAERHNGATAKTRAYEQRKKKQQRENLSRFCPENVPQTPGPEKRREEKSTDTSLRSVSVARKRGNKLTTPSAEHRQIAAERGLSVQTEFEKYRDWQASTGKHHKDEVAGFRNWLRNAKAIPVGRVSSIDVLTGRAHGPGDNAKVVLTVPRDLRESDGSDVEERGPDRSAIGLAR